MKKKWIAGMIGAFLTLGLYAQTIQIQKPISLQKKWFLLDKKEDKLPGMSVEKAYRWVAEKGYKATPVIVAIIDAGIDTNHQDLKQKFWINHREIANGKDDDNNGLVDDRYGWNFLGNPRGDNILKAPSEEYRIYQQFEKQFQQTRDSSFLKDSLYIALKNKFLKDTLEIDSISLNMLYKADSILGKVVGKNIFTIQEIEAKDSLQIFSNPYAKAYLFTFGFSKEKDNQSYLAKMKKKLKKKDIFSMQTYHLFCQTDSLLQTIMNKNIYIPRDLLAFSYFKNSFLLMYYLELWNYQKTIDTTIQIHTNKQFFATLLENKYKRSEDQRATIIGDNENDILDTLYGNPIFPIAHSDHGTHVAGIIGADRNNNIGIKGIADSVKLMILRVVPDGDEYDKDIARAIFYAVNHGAKIINMSFGKSYSPHKQWIDSAVEYAYKNNVLLVHAAGNDFKNLNTEKNYPSSYFLGGKRAKNYITVGAVGLDSKQHIAVADFSNYGNEVEIYAPGVNIFSCMPNGGYGEMSGTSMAAPMVSGVAAFLWSYFPDLSAVAIKNIITQSAHSIHFSKKQALSPLLENIKMVNAYEAIKMASQFSTIR